MHVYCLVCIVALVTLRAIERKDKSQMGKANCK